jgi:molecular chaperone Hsp33
VAGLLLQRLPDQGGTSEVLVPGAFSDTWERAGHLASTLKTDELLGTPIDTLIHRLYWEETLIAFEPISVRWHCPCTRTRVSEMLRMLGRGEVEDILAEQGKVEVACDFCGKPYVFDAVDCARIFSGAQTLPEQDPPTVH